MQPLFTVLHHDHHEQKGGDIEDGHIPTHASDSSLHLLHRPVSIIANPSPAGVISFASTSFILSMYNINAAGVHTPNIVLGMAIFAGGILQFIAGMWQFPRGDVYSATVFSTYGTFWMSWAVIQLPGTGVLAAYTDERELGHALGIFLITWFIVTLIFIVAVIRRNLTFIILLSVLAVSFLLLSLGEFTGNVSFTKAGGATGILNAAIAYYVAVSDLLAAEAKPIIVLPQGVWYENN
ncbi:hypothetical protein D9619_012199 [Psilocybe cf. subviscida]|uniref:Gpr1 family protein n=1 Tax=Psilocybe cf. subviscida TaxID=2480587 RepID=A0A8H5B7R1_9AGAR|nr:hypothetical protein D9619_012199 [Psilocybe cf. subviscida]